MLDYKQQTTTDKLTKRVQVWGMIENENELNEIEHRPQLIKTIWGKLIPQTGSMGNRANTEFAKMTHKIIVRYAAGKDIKNTHYLMYAGRRYDVLYTLNPYEANVEIEIFASEVLEQ
ncbi:MAG: head-tail adaptor protein [Clostridia bacterium]|jgi:head-tail adaptor|nr:head-tail adaptor protein [Clostridia bacterium]